MAKDAKTDESHITMQALFPAIILTSLVIKYKSHHIPSEMSNPTYKKPQAYLEA
jgi:hypothetical protein